MLKDFRNLPTIQNQKLNQSTRKKIKNFPKITDWLIWTSSLRKGFNIKTFVWWNFLHHNVSLWFNSLSWTHPPSWPAHFPQPHLPDGSAGDLLQQIMALGCHLSQVLSLIVFNVLGHLLLVLLPLHSIVLLLRLLSFLLPLLCSTSFLILFSSSCWPTGLQPPDLPDSILTNCWTQYDRMYLKREDKKSRNQGSWPTWRSADKHHVWSRSCLQSQPVSN